MNIEAKIKLVVGALEDIKARDISVLDTSKLTSLFERMVIARPGRWPAMCAKK